MSNAYDFRENVKRLLLEKLYKAQLNYWNNRLRAVAIKNTRAHGRGWAANAHEYVIYYNDKSWQYQVLDWVEKEHSKFCLPLHPDFPQMEDEMEEIAFEFEEIRLEMYEADRFISGLVTMPAPPEVLEQILGDTLYSACKDVLLRYRSANECTWNNSSELTLNTYVAKNQRIIRLMTERLMLNLITLSNKHQY